MQQRIGIAQALLGNPELVVLDEPSIGLDPVGMVEVRELVKAISKGGMTVFVSSHLLFEVEQICSHVTIINRGQALVSDTLENVSRIVSGPASVQVEVFDLTVSVIAAIKEISAVKDVTRNGNMLKITLTTREDIRSQVSKAITGAGGTIVGMSQRGHSLEDVFIQLINKPIGGNKQ